MPSFEDDICSSGHIWYCNWGGCDVLGTGVTQTSGIQSVMSLGAIGFIRCYGNTLSSKQSVVEWMTSE